MDCKKTDVKVVEDAKEAKEAKEILEKVKEILKEKNLETEKFTRDAIKRFEWLITFLICRFKFIHQILSLMVKIPNDSISTMGVRVTESGKFELLYSPSFVHSLSDEELTYVLFHEVLHLTLHHCTRRQLVHIKDKRHPTKEEASAFSMANIALDLAVNELIPNDNVCKPPMEKGKLVGAHVEVYKEKEIYKDMKEMQNSEYYYDFLLKNTPPEKKGGKGGGKDNKDGGKDGKGNESFDVHDNWREHETASELIRAKIKEISKSETWGDVSQSFKEIVNAAQIRKINWRNKIRTFFGNLAWKHKMSTRKRPNRRFGYAFPGTKKSYVDRWLIAADTSGSINSELLGKWVGVLNQIAEEYPIDFMQFDHDKTEDPQPYDRRRVKIEFVGRGGTSFQPVVDIVEKKKYKGLMILTDGEASAPSKPRNCKVLWVMPEGCTAPVDWGDRVIMERHV